MVTTEEIYLIIRLRIFLEISFECKSDYSLLHALQTTLFLDSSELIPKD